MGLFGQDKQDKYYVTICCRGEDFTIIEEVFFGKANEVFRSLNKKFSDKKKILHCDSKDNSFAISKEKIIAIVLKKHLF